MGFTDIKHQAIQCLQTANFNHVIRDDLDEKNHLLSGKVSVAALVAILKMSRGHEHTQSAHHQDSSIAVHVIVTGGWYIKFYFDPDLMFISVHPEN